MHYTKPTLEFKCPIARICQLFLLVGEIRRPRLLNVGSPASASGSGAAGLPACGGAAVRPSSGRGPALLSPTTLRALRYASTSWRLERLAHRIPPAERFRAPPVAPGMSLTIVIERNRSVSKSRGVYTEKRRVFIGCSWGPGTTVGVAPGATTVPFPDAWHTRSTISPV